jgi:hypothetical protein
VQHIQSLKSYLSIASESLQFHQNTPFYTS